MKQILTVLFLSFAVMAMANNGPGEGYKVGDVATDFSLMNIDGKMVSLDHFDQAKGYVVIFTCNHCPFAVMYEDRIKALDEKYSPMGYQVIAINPNDPEVVPEDSFEGMKERAAEKDFKFPYLFDEGQKVFPEYGATKTPHVFLLDKSRVVQYIGAIDDNARDASSVETTYLEDAIMALDQGKEINPKTTKAVGCSIKVKK